jgi:hypothetical protein
MPPTRQQIHVDRVLQGFSQAYIQDRAGFVWRDAMPSFGVDAASGTYFKYTQKHWLMNSMQRRTRGGPYARGGWELTTANYALDQWGLEKPMADEDVAEANEPLNIEEDAVQWLEMQNDINGEELFAAAFMAKSIWTTDDDNATTDWDDASGKPITDVQLAQRTVMEDTGMTPNAMVCGKIVKNALVLNAQITDLIKYTQSALPRDIEPLLAKALDLEFLYVSTAAHDTTAEGVTASIAPIMDDDALVYYRAPKMLTKKTAVAGSLFYWQDGGGLGLYDRYRDESHKSDVARITAYYDHFVIGAELGYFFFDVV